MAPSCHAASQSTAPLTTDPTLTLQPPPQALNGDRDLSPQPQLRTIAAIIKDTLSAAIADLRHDIGALSDRVLDVEKNTSQHDTVLCKATKKIYTPTLQLRKAHRHIEDLDNRGLRHNLRIRGMPESIDPDHLSAEVTLLFNTLLHRPLETRIDMERIHRALRPRGRETDPPRDVICCIVDFTIKEDIL